MLLYLFAYFFPHGQDRAFNQYHDVNFPDLFQLKINSMLLTDFVGFPRFLLGRSLVEHPSIMVRNVSI